MHVHINYAVYVTEKDHIICLNCYIAIGFHIPEFSKLILSWQLILFHLAQLKSKSLQLPFLKTVFKLGNAASGVITFMTLSGHDSLLLVFWK